MNRTIKPSRAFYGVAAGVLVIGLIFFIVSLASGITGSLDNLGQKVVVPGKHVVELEEAGDYNIYFENESSYDGIIYKTESISGLSCSLVNTQTGEEVTLSDPAVNSNYHMGNRSGYSIFTFEITEPGKYELTASYKSGTGEEAVLVVGKGFGTELTITILGSMGVLFACVIAAIGIFLFVFYKRNNTRRKQMA